MCRDTTDRDLHVSGHVILVLADGGAASEWMTYVLGLVFSLFSMPRSFVLNLFFKVKVITFEKKWSPNLDGLN